MNIRFANGSTTITLTKTEEATFYRAIGLAACIARQDPNAEATQDAQCAEHALIRMLANLKDHSTEPTEVDPPATTPEKKEVEA